MKKNFIYLLLLFSLIAQAQVTPSYPTIKLTKTTEGVKQDSLLVIGTDKTVKHIPYSKISSVQEFATASALPVTGVAGKIYITKDNNKIYTWNGTFYSEFVGAKGEKGDQGVAGIQGVKGDQGIQGLKGDTGLTGLKGDKGDVGLTGSIGLTGAKGDKGDIGLTGLAGTNGAKGEKGDQGLQGFKGDTGADGAMGSQGPQGIQGIQGETGLRGIQGETGPQGPIGFTGQKGADGTGVSIKGSFDNTSQLPASGAAGDAYLINGNLHVWNGTAWINVGSIQGPQGLIGLTGATGSQGIQGVKGDKGDQGIQGIQGLKGDTGAKGDTGSFNGDITADQVTETATRKFQTPTQSAYNDATSSIQGQLNSKEPAFSKNTAFNKNFGNTSLSVAEGNDSRINNGQTAFSWGNHAGLYSTISGSNINQASFRIALGLGSNAYTSTAYLPIQDDFRDNTDYNTRLTSGFYNGSANPINKPTNGEYGQLIVAKGVDTGFQIAGYSNINAPDMSIRAWGDYGSSFTPWRKLWHDGNFIPDGKVDKVAGKSLIADSEITRLATVTNQDISGKENTFTKNTAFNKNFGIAASTVAEGNDSRIINGQTSFSWGNHAGLYSTISGSNINQSSFRTALGLGSNAYTSTAYLPIQDGFRDNTDYNTRLTSGFYNVGAGAENMPSGAEYGQLIVAKGVDTGFQIAGYSNNNAPDMSIRAWGDYGSSFTPWRKLWHDGNFIPDGKVDKVAGKSLISDSEITRLATVTNQDISGKFDKTGGTISGNTSVTGTVTASGGFFNSDRRLKNIFKRDGDVAYYTWKDGRDTKEHIGYVAQSVQKTHPNQVQADDKGILSVNYVEILVEKIRVLEKRIDQLEKSK